MTLLIILCIFTILNILILAASIIVNKAFKVTVHFSKGTLPHKDK